MMKINRGRDCTDEKLLTLYLLPQKACPFCMKHKRSGRERGRRRRQQQGYNHPKERLVVGGHLKSQKARVPD
jgi:hypothetical protein